MKKPLSFAIRGAVGFGLAIFFKDVGYVMAAFGAAAISIGVYCLGFMSAAAVLFYGTSHWKRATLGFALTYVIITTAAKQIAIEFLPSGNGVLSLAADLLFTLFIFAIIGGVGCCWKSVDLALPGAVAFALPTLFFGLFVRMAPPWVFDHSALIFSGALLGFFVGRSEARACPASAPARTQETVITITPRC